MPNAPSPTALDGLKIVELASFVAAPYCAKLLADMGAEVVKVEEPPQGDLARSRGPYPGDMPHPEKSGLFIYLNTNKKSVTLNITDPAGHEILLQLLREADVFVHDRTAKQATELGIGYDALQALNPRLIVTSVTPFGHTGPYAEYKAHDLNISQAGSEGYVLPGGYANRMKPEGPPVKLGGHTGDYDGGIAAAVGTMAALMAREMHGMGQHVDASRQEANIALNRVLFVTYLSENKVYRRATRNYYFGGLYPTSDGYIALRPSEDKQWWLFSEKVMERPDLSHDPRFDTRPDRVKNGKEFDAIVADWSRQFTKQEIFDRCLAVGVPVGPFATAKEVADSPQIQFRRYFQEIQHPAAGRVRIPTAAHQFAKTPWSLRQPPPQLGEHNKEVLGGRIGLTGEELTILRSNGII